MPALPVPLLSPPAVAADVFKVLADVGAEGERRARARARARGAGGGLPDPGLVAALGRR